MKKIVFVVVLLGMVGVVGIARYANKSVVNISYDKLHPNPKNKDAKRVDFSEMLGSYNGKERADILFKMAPFLLPEERKMYMDELKKSVVNKDELFIKYVLEQLPKFKLQKEEYEDLAKIFHTEKESKVFKDNWPMAQEQFKSIGVSLE